MISLLGVFQFFFIQDLENFSRSKAEMSSFICMIQFQYDILNLEIKLSNHRGFIKTGEMG